MWMKQHRSSIAQIVVLSVGIVSTLTMLSFSWIPKAVDIHREMPYRTELGDERAAERILRHGFGAGGQPWTAITFQHGDRGQASYRPDGTLKEFVVTFASGKPRLYAQFDRHGKDIVSGFEVRDDGSKVWTVEKLPDGKLKTVSYWKGEGQKVFSEVVRDTAAGTIERSYYRGNGILWAHQVQVESGAEMKVVAEEVYHESGKPARIRKSPLGANEALMAYYRYDGTLEYTQHFGPEPGAGVMKPNEGAKPPMVQALLATNIYGDDGKRILKQIGFQGQATSVPWIALINEDGSMDVTHYALTQQVVKKEHLLPNGTVVSSESRFRRPERMEPIDTKYRENFPALADPSTDWNKTEDRAWLDESVKRAINRHAQ